MKVFCFRRRRIPARGKVEYQAVAPDGRVLATRYVRDDEDPPFPHGFDGEEILAGIYDKVGGDVSLVGTDDADWPDLASRIGVEFEAAALLETGPPDSPAEGELSFDAGSDVAEETIEPDAED